MKQTRLDEYRPNYPKKLLKGAALTAAAVVALGSSLGCIARFETTTSGAVAIDEPTPMPTEELVLDGEVAIDEPPQLEGYMIPEDTPEPEEPAWMGDVAVDPNLP